MKPDGLARIEGNATGGGVTEPPYINVTFVASDASDDSGTISFLHAKPWERNDPSAERGHAELKLTIIQPF